MILVDSGVWIDYFRGTATPQVERLDALFAEDVIAVGDLIVAEVLQGFRSSRDATRAREALGNFAFVELGGWDAAVRAAKNFAALRALGFTPRTVDTFIATKCIDAGYALLHRDRDFDAFEAHLGLHVVACPTA